MKWICICFGFFGLPLRTVSGCFQGRSNCSLQEAIELAPERIVHHAEYAKALDALGDTVLPASNGRR
ncbi:MAG TPA: hypothetical protein VGF37_02085 [Chthoniobacterales bacterium]